MVARALCSRAGLPRAHRMLSLKRHAGDGGLRPPLRGAGHRDLKAFARRFTQALAALWGGGRAAKTDRQPLLPRQPTGRTQVQRNPSRAAVIGACGRDGLPDRG